MGKKVIYILRHQDKAFSGYIHGVGFSRGRGSTSSAADLEFLTVPHHPNKKAICEDITEEYWKKRRQEEAIRKARESKVGKEKDEPEAKEAEKKQPYSKRSKKAKG
ncbi:hypothetical protein CMI37_30965 [Candidatus Pacearchaeota archaeon]|nr:hypothetical protein [Candidatus Pacearchaeota archaeon]|tara:strand:- start:5984 stop:6301 length:318 start_codon:yes stop_codon:yes gene_type:complete